MFPISWRLLNVVFVGLSLGLGAAQADSITFKADDGVQWRVFFDPPVMLTFDDTKKPNGTIGTLTMTVIRQNNKSITLGFQQESVAATTGVTEGLRLNFEAKITNATGIDWSGNQLRLIDDAPAVAGVKPSDNHPAWPHFHPRTTLVKASFKPYVFDLLNLNDPADLLLINDFGVNLVKANPNEVFEVANLLLHERHFAPQDLVSFDPGLRLFRLVEAPVPIPVTGL